MSAYRFSSCLAAQMDRFVNLRRLSGTDYHSQTRLLEYFDRFLVQQALTGHILPVRSLIAISKALQRLPHARRATVCVSSDNFASDPTCPDPAAILKSCGPCWRLCAGTPLLNDPLKSRTPTLHLQLKHVGYSSSTGTPAYMAAALQTTAVAQLPLGSEALRPHTYRT